MYDKRTYVLVPSLYTKSTCAGVLRIEQIQTCKKTSTWKLINETKSDVVVVEVACAKQRKRVDLNNQ